MRKPRFTLSLDSVNRCTITISFRFTEEEYSVLEQRRQKEYPYCKSVSDMLSYSVRLDSLLSPLEPNSDTMGTEEEV